MHRLALCLLLSLGAVQAATLSETLPNGMKVVIKEDHRAPVAVSQLWYNIGSVDEAVGKTGLSHALEHMMFKGTAKVPSGQFSRTVAALGGEDNAYTNRNHTVYHETVAAAHLPQVLAMEADRMVNLNFSDADFRNEMKVIREERRLRTDDQPGGVLWEGINQRAFDRAHNRADYRPQVVYHPAPPVYYAPPTRVVTPVYYVTTYRGARHPHHHHERWGQAQGHWHDYR